MVCISYLFGWKNIFSQILFWGGYFEEIYFYFSGSLFFTLLVQEWKGEAIQWER